MCSFIDVNFVHSRDRHFVKIFSKVSRVPATKSSGFIMLRKISKYINWHSTFHKYDLKISIFCGNKCVLMSIQKKKIFRFLKI